MIGKRSSLRKKCANFEASCSDAASLLALGRREGREPLDQFRSCFRQVGSGQDYRDVLRHACGGVDGGGRVFACWGTSFNGGINGITIGGIIKGQAQLPKAQQS